MTLVYCDECARQVSSKAAVCPGCGAPIAGIKEYEAAGTPLMTTQETSKKFKLWVLLAWIAMIGGCVGFFNSDNPSTAAGPTPDQQIFAWMMVIGFFVWIGAKVKIWWHHK